MKSPATDPALAAAILVIAALVGLGAGVLGYFVMSAFHGG
jgi:phage shock protein PspC (stress-responsive transcriptional regulator)